MLKKQKKRNKSFLQNRNVTYLFLLVLGGLYLLFSDMGIFRWHQLREERNQVQAEIDHLIQKEKEFTHEIDRLENNVDYIKKIAQERFRMVKPGEKVFRVVDRRKIDN